MNEFGNVCARNEHLLSEFVIFAVRCFDHILHIYMSKSIPGSRSCQNGKPYVKSSVSFQVFFIHIGKAGKIGFIVLRYPCNG